MGTVAVSVVSQDINGNERIVNADVTFSSSYATGGDTIPLGVLGLKQVDELHVQGGVMSAVVSKRYTPNTHGIQPVFAGTNVAPLLKAIAGTAGAPAEVTNATNLSTVPAVRIRFLGSC